MLPINLGHFPHLFAMFEPWMKHLIVLDMKQQYILKLILLRAINLFSTGINSQIPCDINDLLLYMLQLHITTCNFLVGASLSE